MLTPNAIHDAYSDGYAARIAARPHRVAEEFRALFVEAQSTTSAILCHGANDRSELNVLARMCDVPRNVLAFEVRS